MKVFPVIHHLDLATTISEAQLAFKAGVDGVFLISHHGDDDELDLAQLHLRQQFPDAFIGVNYLTSPPGESAWWRAIRAEYSAVWIDNVGINSGFVDENGVNLISAIMQTSSTPPLLFGSVAFKYQKESTDPDADAYMAKRLGYIPTTSGSKTGSPPELQKIASMSRTTDGLLAVASGLTPENISSYRPYISHALVSTGISSDEYHIDPRLLEKFIEAAKQ